MANGWAAWAPHFDHYGFDSYAIFPLEGGQPVLSKGDNIPDGSFVPKILKNINNNNAALEKIIVGDYRMIGVTADDNCFVGRCRTDASICAYKCNICLVVVVGGKDSDPRQYNDKVVKLGKLLNGES